MIATDEFPGKVKEYECLYRVASHLYDVLVNVGSAIHVPSIPASLCKNLSMCAQGVAECIQ